MPSPRILQTGSLEFRAYPAKGTLAAMNVVHYGMFCRNDTLMGESAPAEG